MCKKTASRISGINALWSSGCRAAAGYSRKTTPVVLTELSYEGYTGYGEASMPPYLGESQESVMGFLNKLNLGQFKDPFLMDDILDYVGLGLKHVIGKARQIAER